VGQRIDNLLRNPNFHEFLRKNDANAEMEMPSPMGATMTLGVRNVPAGRGMSVLIARDVTQRVKVRDMRKAFVADVSHELRTPLTVIQGYLELLQDDKHLPEETQAGLQHVVKQSQRMHHIVEDLLQLSKMEGNPLAEGEGDSIDVGAMLELITSDLTKGVGKQHHFDLNIDPTLHLIGSEPEIYSVVNNLIINAVKYTDDGSNISISWRRDNQRKAVFSVKDDGAGIEPRHLPRLSERFYRVDQGRSRERGGTGLGLAIVKHVSQRHGGQLLIESVPGQGSAFTVVFPAQRAKYSPKAVNL
jgi:two-component system phosphate regulon sensor histidine kinase PhoR